MAAPSKNFNAPTDGQVDGDSPIDITLMTQLRDCLIHLEEWLGGSYTAAVDHNHDGVNSALLQVASAGDVPNVNGGATTNLTSMTYIKIFEFLMPVGGEFRFKWDTDINYGGDSVSSRIYRNGVAVGTVKTAGTTVGTYVASDDVSGWSQGDLIQLWATGNTIGNPTVSPPTLSNFRIFADNAYAATEAFT